MEGEGQGSEMEGQPAWTRIPRDKSVQKGRVQDGGGERQEKVKGPCGEEYKQRK